MAKDDAMGRPLPQQADAPARVVDRQIAEAKAKAEKLTAFWTKEGEKEIERVRAQQARAYARVVELVERAEGLLSRSLRLDHERVLWFLLRMDNPRAWLPPADWGRGHKGAGGEPEAIARRTLIMAETIRHYAPDININDLHREVMAAAPWKHRAGPRKASPIAPEAWVFALLLESAGAPWDAKLFALVFDMVVHVKGQSAATRRHGGQRAQAVRQALKPRGRTAGQERLAFARRMARLWYVSDAWGFEARIRARRGNPP